MKFHGIPRKWPRIKATCTRCDTGGVITVLPSLSACMPRPKLTDSGLEERKARRAAAATQRRAALGARTGVLGRPRIHATPDERLQARAEQARERRQRLRERAEVIMKIPAKLPPVGDSTCEDA
eukprot:TRINITY_DN6537_c1_g1_i1.p1 TRINITY_DN6537_c1_g1~~TRINITY_DN6537_c1_g1_i1.p1  ORF type:complete len:124 (-),score=6.38 TRINITY_DN6537_c1_g1_i1:653-1024(-)